MLFGGLILRIVPCVCVCVSPPVPKGFFQQGAPECTLDWHQRRRQCLICEINPGRWIDVPAWLELLLKLFTVLFLKGLTRFVKPFCSADQSSCCSCASRSNIQQCQGLVHLRVTNWVNARAVKLYI